MLFSSREVAEQINDIFEPAWESVRPAPIVTIDFGNGQKVQRTLQGNIATYICSADGVVIDVLPGIYAPDVYAKKLQEIGDLASELPNRPIGSIFEAAELAAVRASQLRKYHREQAAALRRIQQQPPQFRAIAQIGGGMKGGGFPGPQQFALGGGFGGGFGGGGGFQALGGGFGGGGGFGWAPNSAGGGGIEGPTERVIAGLPALPAPATAATPLAKRPELQVDSQVNEQIRRLAVHERLASTGPVRPDDIKKWLYKEVLHADIDDPLLGLGLVLNANYPFAEEDRAIRGRSAGP